MRGHAATDLTNVAHGPGRRPQPPRHAGPAGHVRRSATSTTTSTRNVRGDAPRARHARRAHVHARRQRHGPGPPDHLVQALRRRQHQRQHRARPRRYTDGRTWVTAMGHFGASYTENGGDNNLVKQIVGGVRWVAGEGKQVRLLGHRLVLASPARCSCPTPTTRSASTSPRTARSTGRRSATPISLQLPRATSRCTTRKGPPGNKTTVVTIPTRADHGNSEDGVLGMQPAAGLRPRGPDQAQRLRLLLAAQPATWPTSGNVAGRRLQPDQPLHADRRRHRGGARTPSA